MRQMLRNVWLHGNLALMPLFAQLKDTPKSVADRVDAGPSPFMELMKTWWLWGGIILLIALIALFVYLRNKPQDDDD
jgi:hypothetical protein